MTASIFTQKPSPESSNTPEVPFLQHLHSLHFPGIGIHLLDFESLFCGTFGSLQDFILASLERCDQKIFVRCVSRMLKGADYGASNLWNGGCEVGLVARVNDGGCVIWNRGTEKP